MIDETLLLTYGASAHVVRKVNTKGAEGKHQRCGWLAPIDWAVYNLIKSK